MASKQIQCEMCCNENAVGYCKTCGNVGETCKELHKTVKVFQTHTVSVNDEYSGSPKVTKRDIAEERCQQHPTERKIFLCEIHDSLICGRCLHSEHSSCVKEVVDLLHGDISIDCDKVNSMKSLLTELKAETMFLKDEAEHSKESCKNNADKCLNECMELGNKIKQQVDVLTSNIKDGISKKYEENLNTYSHITKMCDEKTKWCDNEESKIDDFVDNKVAGHLYLVSRKFEKEVSDARSDLREIKHKHTFKGIDFKENKVILKCVFEDLEEVCEQQEEVTGSDDGNTNDVCSSTSKLNKTRRELTALLTQVKQDLYQLEKKRKSLEQELLEAKQGMEEAKKETAILQAKVPHLKELLKWTQPTGTLQVKTGRNYIFLDFQFPDGIQKTHHSSPGKLYEGGRFTARLSINDEGQLICKMLKAVFRRGLMFILGNEGKVVLYGVSLSDGRVYDTPWSTTPAYDKYIQTLKAELAVKGITEADGQTEKLEETFTVDGP